MKEYIVELFKDKVLVRTTNVTMSGQSMTLEQLAKRAYQMMMVSGYDQNYDAFSIKALNSEETFYMELVE